jgi:hypothetical protein
VIFIETSIFTNRITGLLTDEEYHSFQLDLMAAPTAGAVIRGGGGIRKIRFAAKGKGKSGGIRVIYYILKEDRVFLLLAYPKNEQENLTAAQLKLLSHTVNQML